MSELSTRRGAARADSPCSIRRVHTTGEEYIAFRSDRDGKWAIYVMKPDGTGVTKVVDADVFPLWFLEKMAWKP